MLFRSLWIHETTALAITWTLLLLATHPEWQTQLRDEIKEVVKDGEFDVNMLAGLKKVYILSHYVLLALYFVSCDQFVCFREARLMSKVLYIIYGIEYMVVKLYRGLVIHAHHI